MPSLILTSLFNVEHIKQRLQNIDMSTPAAKLAAVFWTSVLFVAAYFIGSNIVRRYVKYKGMPRAVRIAWDLTLSRLLFISIVTLGGCWTVANRDMFVSDVVNITHIIPRSMVLFTVGYFISDIAMLLYLRQPDTSLLLHHFGTLTAYALIAFYDKFHYMAALSLLLESIHLPLPLIKYLQYLSNRKNVVTTLNLCKLFVFVSRYGYEFYIWYNYWMFLDVIRKDLPWPVIVSCVGSGALLTAVLTPYWICRVLSRLIR